MNDNSSTQNPDLSRRISAAQLRSGEFDQPTVDPSRPANWYIICTSPRSGSHLLGRLLANAGIGLPLEYFNIRTNVDLRNRWSTPDGDHASYLTEALRRRTTPNGVWGSLLQWSHYSDYQQVIDQRLLPNARLIYLYRRDLVSQAISLHLARRTGFWGFDGVPTTPRRTDSRGRPRGLGSIRHTVKCAGALNEESRHWQNLFEARRPPLLRMAYEEIVKDQPAAIRTIADFLGLPADAYRIPSPEPRDNKMPEEVEIARKRLANHRLLLRMLIGITTRPGYAP
jgi:trehalose 2-sulfotransferase